VAGVGLLQRGADYAHDALVRGLNAPGAYPRPAEVTHLETHISHVFLVGEYAYKIKKPLALGFLDFSTLERRRRFCEEELRINRRLAPELYLAVVPIGGSPDAPHVEGDGAPIEYAVKMRRFEQDGLLEHVLERGALTPELIDALADQVARFHAEVERAPAGGRFGAAASIVAPALQNFDQLAPLIDTAAELTTLEALRRWTTAQHETLSALFDARQRAGFVRECHGDLHLGNIVLVDGKLRIFDAIEFNPELRWIDVVSEVAFLAMDLAARGREDFGWRFVNRYLEHTGDYDGVRLLRYYLVYRALVRAKVAAMRAAQADTGERERRTLADKCRRHLEVAQRFALGAQPVLAIHHGLSGSGKTVCSQVILETLGAIRIRSDVERKRQHGLESAQRAQAAVGEGIYQPQATLAVYARLAGLARASLAGGFPTLIDATFLERGQREAFHALARELAVPFRIAWFRAPADMLRERVARRARQGDDASDAGLAVLDHQLRSVEPLTAEEQALSVCFDTQDLDGRTQSGIERIRALARRLLPSPASHDSNGGKP
jgi:hypothetical protein